MRREYDHEARLYREFNAANVKTLERAYTAAENAVADAAVAQLAAATNKGATEANILSDLTTLQTNILAPTNAVLNSDFAANPAKYLKDIARALKRLDRVALQKFDAAD